ncbi:MAG: hypothetical protein N2606_04000 [Candidatus Omnitrophica bacterium]|nr:hypothetical protein [Candidatus Omnitrophota bacterium]
MSRFLIYIFIIMQIIGCQRPDGIKKEDFVRLRMIPSRQWENLSSKRIFFGHQSVGVNIIEGIKELSGLLIDGLKLNIKETTNLEDFQGPVFAHKRIGRNLDPYSKCDEFRSLMESGLGQVVDIAFFKFCYVDITSSTDIDKLISYYESTMSYLKEKYPNVKFIHFTVPLTVNYLENGWKSRIKRILRGEKGEVDNNIARNIFNKELIKRMGSMENIFDLAKYEAMFMNGKMNIFHKRGIGYYFLISSYTDDGGHLNILGRRYIARKFLEFLVSLDSSQGN